MTSTQLRRVTSRSLDDVIRQLNALIDRDLGNATGRIDLVSDGGLVKDLQGGTSTASAIPAIRVYPASGEQMQLKTSAGATAFRVQDAAITAGVQFNGTGGAFSGNVTVGGTLGVTGAATVSGLLTASASITATGVVTVTNNAAPQIVLKGSGSANGVQIYETDGTTLAAFVGIDTSSNTVAINAQATGYEVQIQTQGVDRIRVTSVHTALAGRFGCNGVTPPAAPSLGSAAGAAYVAATQTLINNIRSCLIDNGLATA